MQIINQLAEILSEKVGISALASRGLIKLAIKEEFGPFKPSNQIGLRDFICLIQNSLKLRLQKLNVENLEEIINYLLDELVNHQSLITMERI